VKKIIFTPPARADVRRIDRDTAMRILTALDRFARTGEGDIKKLEGNTGELRLRVGDYRVRFIETRPARSTFTPSCTVPKPTANLEHSSDDGSSQPRHRRCSICLGMCFSTHEKKTFFS
jgi:mRNA interferase RelE/StbE